MNQQKHDKVKQSKISRGSLLYYDIMACIYTYVGLMVPVYFKTRLYFFK